MLHFQMHHNLSWKLHHSLTSAQKAQLWASLGPMAPACNESPKFRFRANAHVNVQCGQATSPHGRSPLASQDPAEEV